MKPRRVIMALLRTDHNGFGTHIFRLTSMQTVIGRHPDCAICLNHPTVSRRHARILFQQGGFMIEDLESRNGTFINEVQIQSLSPLQHGDQLRIGDISFQFEDNAPSASTLATVILDPGSLMDELHQPINVTSQIDLRLARGTTPLPATLNDCQAKIQNLSVKMEVILKLMKEFGKAKNYNEVLADVLSLLLELFPQADFDSLLTLNDLTGRLEITDFRTRSHDPQTQFKISRSIPQRVYDTRTAILTENNANDHHSDPSLSMIHNRIRSIMAVPILEPTSQEVLGVIQIDARISDARFTEQDLDLLVTVANQVATLNEHFRLLEDRRKEEMLLKDMDTAFQVQKGFLPLEQPQLNQIDFFDFYQPAKIVGGDFYDYIDLPDGRKGIIVADVSGKGMPAALLVAKLSSEVRLCLMQGKTLPEAMKRLNTIFAVDRYEHRFFTMVLVVIDPNGNRFTLLNAGHVYPFRISASGEVEELGVDQQGFAIGMIPDSEYQEMFFEMAPEDKILLMSDGIPDSLNSTGENFGNDRVRQFLQDHAHLSSKALGRALIQTIQDYVGETPQADDQCVVIFGKKLETDGSVKKL